MPSTKTFVENTLAAGEKAPDSIVRFKFELNEGITEENIDYIKPGCPACTKAKLVGNKIIGFVDVAKANMDFLPGKTPLTKTVLVYLNDGRKSIIGKPKTKEMIPNPDKEFERLNIACVVVK